MTARRLAKYGVVLAMAACGLLLCLDVAYLVRGSLEAFPTDEKMEEVRLVTALLAAVLVGLEAGLLLLYRRLDGGGTGRKRARDDASPPAA